MRLQLNLSKDYPDLKAFVDEWIIPSLKKLLKANAFKIKDQLNFYYGQEILPLLIRGINSINSSYSYSRDKIVISIDPNVFCVEKNAKLYDICAQVNYGSLQFPALPIFTKQFDYIAENFWVLYNDYKLGILPWP